MSSSVCLNSNEAMLWQKQLVVYINTCSASFLESSFYDECIATQNNRQYSNYLLTWEQRWNSLVLWHTLFVGLYGKHINEADSARRIPLIPLFPWLPIYSSGHTISNMSVFLYDFQRQVFAIRLHLLKQQPLTFARRPSVQKKGHEMVITPSHAKPWQRVNLMAWYITKTRTLQRIRLWGSEIMESIGHSIMFAKWRLSRI